jgi:hypothetical protein
MEEIQRHAAQLQVHPMKSLTEISRISCCIAIRNAKDIEYRISIDYQTYLSWRCASMDHTRFIFVGTSH